MKKIEPVAWALRENGGICFDKSIADKWDDKPSPLYTREALEAVAEAVKNAAWKVAYSEEAAEAVSNIDTAAIINQLTRE